MFVRKDASIEIRVISISDIVEMLNLMPITISDSAHQHVQNVAIARAGGGSATRMGC